jgi:vancomycin permeability regulator SanA
LALLLAAAAAAFFIINAVVTSQTEKYIYHIDDIEQLDKADCVIVLGARVYENGSLSAVLQDRVDYAIALYQADKADKLLFTGDHGQTEYDEVNAMMAYALDKGIPESDIFLDHAGFSTYESMYRARDVFLASDVIIVTQAFHLPRAVYTARRLGLDAVGVNSDPRVYVYARWNEFRERFARIKDFFYVNVFAPEPKYLGESIPIFGDGAATHDKG